MPHPVRRIPHLPLRARDGTVLSAAVWLPDAPGDGPWPAIVDAVPYRKDDDFRSLDQDTYAPIAAEGFACVRLDLRGTGSSEGVLLDEYTPTEHEDLEDVLAALAALDWCTGRIGVTGVSWGGFNAVQLAMRRPPHLEAIAPIHWSHDRYSTDVHYVGGTLHCADSVEWPSEMLVELPLPPLRRMVGDEAFEELWRLRLEETPPWPFEWLRHQRRDAYWRHGSLCEDWASIEVPVLSIGGWQDGYRDACLALLAHGRSPRRAIIGPWGHARPHRGWPAPGFDHRQELARWFARWLKDERNGVDEEPALVAFVGDGPPREPYPDRVPGRWRAWRAWPPAAPRTLVLHLGAEGELADEPPAAAQAPVWDGPPWVGMSSPWWCVGSPPGGSGADMRPDDAASLTWDTPPLDEPLTIVGNPVVHVTVSADRPVALLAARLEAVAPDGRSSLITRGVLNLTHRRSHADPEPLAPGEPEEVALELMGCGCSVPAGERLRLALAGADWPNAWPPPEQAALTFHLGPGGGGRLELPLPVDADEVDPPAMAEPVHPEPAETFGDADPIAPAWSIEREHVTGTTRMRMDSGWDTTLPDGGRTVGIKRLLLSVRDNDPASCRAEADAVAEIEHDGDTARAEARLVFACDRDVIDVVIEVRVLRDGAPFWERVWRERFDRDLL